MSFHVTISTDNAEFHQGVEHGDDSYNPASVLAQLLRNIADTLDEDVPTELADPKVPTTIGSIRDRNGNHVGEWRHDRPTEP
jgi:hypothetical protein